MSDTVTLRLMRANATHDFRTYNFFHDLSYTDRDAFVGLLRIYTINPYDVRATFSLSVPLAQDDARVTLHYLERHGAHSSEISTEICDVSFYELPKNLQWRTVEDCRYCAMTERTHVQNNAPIVGYHMYVKPTRDQIHVRMRARLYHLATFRNASIDDAFITHERSIS